MTRKDAQNLLSAYESLNSDSPNAYPLMNMSKGKHNHGVRE